MIPLTPQDLGIAGHGQVHRNLSASALTQAALSRGEGSLSESGAFVIYTGKYTGRSPRDRFLVDSPAVHDSVAWGAVNQPLSPECYEGIRAKLLAYLQGKELFVFDGFAGADPRYARGFRVVNEYACQNLFMHQLLIRPTPQQLASFTPDFTLIAAPGFQCVPELDGVRSETAILIHLERREILIAGNLYCGELKKSVFSVMNYLLPSENVLPMHCSANLGPDGDAAVFFGLSGTGKTTLSSDPARRLIGDDEHGWSPDGIFNLEGGCYAKCIGLRQDREPEIYAALRFGALLENVVLDENGAPDFADNRYTDNTRAGYPLDYIPHSVSPSLGGPPRTIFFLTADAFGVLPPISRLDTDAAMYHFVSGYTSKLAGTERGVTEPTATFSTLFGEPFFPRPASLYAGMLGQRLEETGARVFLINTGWCGGPADRAPRIELRYTRAMVTAALSGQLDRIEYRFDPLFRLQVPVSCPGVPTELLEPRGLWGDSAAYEVQARRLAGLFADNFAAKYPDMPAHIVAAGPRP